MTERCLNLGFIGGGLNSAVGNVHRIASQMDGHWKLLAGCFSEDADINQETGSRWRVPEENVYADWHSFLEQQSKNIDAVVVLTPTPLHDEIVLEAVAKNLPVICEKALTTSADNAARIQQALERNQGFLGVTYNYTGYPMLRELKARIDAGMLGSLSQIQIEMPQEGFAKLDAQGNKAQPQAWRLQDAAIPTLCLDLGVHVHQMVHFLSGQQAQEVTGLSNRHGHFEDISDNMMFLARYSGNLDCQFWISKTALGHANGLRVRVYGDKGAAEWFQMQPDVLSLSDNTGQQSIIGMNSAGLQLAGESRYNRFKAGHPSGFIEAFANHYQDLAQAVSQHLAGETVSNPWVFGVQDALAGLHFFEALMRAVNEKNWQRIHG